MEIFVGLLILGAVAAVIRVASQYAKNINAAWADAARQLGLEFQPGAVFTKRTIRGVRGVTRVELTEKSGGNNNTVREWRLSFPSTPFSMTLTMETPGRKLLKAFGAEDFQVGDPSFDSKFMVSGSDAAAISGFLTSDRRAALTGATSALPGLKVTNSDITWRTTNQYKSSTVLVDHGRRLLALADAMVGEDQASLDRPAPVYSAPPPPPPIDDPWIEAHELPDSPDPAPPISEAEPVEPAPIDQTTVEPEVESTEEPVEMGLVTLEELIDDVFATRRLSFEANNVVAEKYAGRTLLVVGPVRSSRKVTRDFDFRDAGPGARVEAVVGRVTGNRAGAGDVVAIAHLAGGSPPDRGSEVLITGTILKVEPLRRAIYLADAHLG